MPPAEGCFRNIRVEGFSRSRRQLAFSFGADDLRFHTTLWYGDVDFPLLEDRYGSRFMQWVYFHIAAFEINKLAGLRAERLDFGPFCELVTAEFAALWRTVFDKVWAQWRHENHLPFYGGPEMDVATGGSVPAARVDPGPAETLSFCGGGKDSLVAHRMLERAGIGHAALVYSHSSYGSAARQHKLIDRLLGHTSTEGRHRLWIYDDFLDSPVLQLHPRAGIRTLAAGETPASVFAAIPFALQHGYVNLAVGHERSADYGNLVWDATGEEVNHQWGKSLQAERLLDDYLARHLVANLRYFSLLKPVYDVLIFQMLNDHLQAVPDTHSCNVNKPWCKRCPKCAYVWAGYTGHLPDSVAGGVFGANLLDLPENQLAYRQMLGLEAHTPFECIGRVEEARLAFELCRRKGVTGRAMDVYRAEVHDFDPWAVVDHHLAVHPESSNMPGEVAAAIVPQMHDAAETAACRLAAILEERRA